MNKKKNNFFGKDKDDNTDCMGRKTSKPSDTVQRDKKRKVCKDLVETTRDRICQIFTQKRKGLYR